MYKYWQLLRPPQWVKNLFVFAALAFGNAFGKRVGWFNAVEVTFLAFALFFALLIAFPELSLILPQRLM